MLWVLCEDRCLRNWNSATFMFYGRYTGWRVQEAKWRIRWILAGGGKPGGVLIIVKFSDDFVLPKSSGLLRLIVVAWKRVVAWCWTIVSLSQVSFSSMDVWCTLEHFQILVRIMSRRREKESSLRDWYSSKRCSLFVVDLKVSHSHTVGVLFLVVPQTWKFPRVNYKVPCLLDEELAFGRTCFLAFSSFHFRAGQALRLRWWILLWVQCIGWSFQRKHRIHRVTSGVAMSSMCSFAACFYGFSRAPYQPGCALRVVRVKRRGGLAYCPGRCVLSRLPPCRRGSDVQWTTFSIFLGY